MSTRGEAADYWPGYVDALINVVLNLLFLISVFAVGLVSLNMDLTALEQKIIQAKLQEILALGRGMVLQDPDAIAKVNEAPRAPAVAAASAERRLDPKAMLPASPPPGQAAEMQVVVHELKLYSSPLELARLSTTPTTMVLADAYAEGVAHDLQSPQRFTSYLERLTGATVFTKVGFAPQQFDLPHDQILPALDTRDSWTLLVIADKDNPRMLREAFERLNSVGAIYLRTGIDPKKLQIRIASLPTELSRTDDIDTLVWVMKRPPSVHP